MKPLYLRVPVSLLQHKCFMDFKWLWIVKPSVCPVSDKLLFLNRNTILNFCMKHVSILSLRNNLNPFLTQFYESLHDHRFLHSRYKCFFVFLCMHVLVYIRKQVMKRVSDGELCMLITRTEININYYKLDNITSCVKFKTICRWTLYIIFTALNILPDENLFTAQTGVATTVTNW